MSNLRLTAVLALILAFAGPALSDGHAQVDDFSDEGSEIFVLEEPVIVEALPDTPMEPMTFRTIEASDGGTGSIMDELTGRWEDLPGAQSVTGYVPSAETMAALDRLHKATYEHRARALDHRRDVFAWQHVSSQALFGVVIVIVAIGLYFSWMQFHASNLGRDIGRSDIEASDKGVKISSPVLGVIILALSLGFFYLYLNHVYPISEL